MDSDCHDGWLGMVCVSEHVVSSAASPSLWEMAYLMAASSMDSLASYYDFLFVARFACANSFAARKVYGILEHPEVSHLVIPNAISHGSPQVFLVKEDSF